MTISSANGTCTISTSFVLTFVSPGACVLSASQSGGPGYLAAPSVTKSISLVAKTQTISFSPPTSLTIDQSPYTLVATSSSGLPVTVTSSSATVCSVAGFVLTMVSAGTCNLTAAQIGGSGFAAATSVNKSIVATSKPQTISFSPPTSLNFDQSPYTLIATSSSGLSVTISSSTTSVCTVAGFVLTMVSAGTCNLTAAQIGGVGFLGASSVSRQISVVAKTQTIAFSPPSTLAVSQSPYTLVATSSSGLPVTISSSTTSICTVSNFVLTLLNAGSCRLVASQTGGSGYTFASKEALINSLGGQESIVVSTSTFESGWNYDLSKVISVKSGRKVFISGSFLNDEKVCSVSSGAIDARNPGTCELSVLVPASGGWAQINTGVTVRVVLPGLALRQSGTWVSSGSTAEGMQFTLSPGSVALGTRATTRKMVLKGYYSCPAGTVLTSDKLAAGCTLVAPATEYFYWGSLDRCRPGGGCFTGLSKSAGTFYHNYLSPIYAIEIGDGYHRRGGGGPMSILVNYVRWDYLDSKSLPTPVTAPSLSRPSDNLSQLDLKVGSWAGSSTDFYPTPSISVEWGYCPRGVPLPDASCYVLQNLTSSGDAAWRSPSANLMTSNNWQIYALVRAMNSFGYTNLYLTWTAPTQ